MSTCGGCSVLFAHPGDTWKPPISGNMTSSWHGYGSREKGISGRRLSGLLISTFSSFPTCQLKGFYCSDIRDWSGSHHFPPVAPSLSAIQFHGLSNIRFTGISLAQKPLSYRRKCHLFAVRLFQFFNQHC